MDTVNNLVVAVQEARFLVLALILIVLDVAYAVLRHAAGRDRGEQPVLEFVEGKITVIFILLVAAAIDPLVPDVPLLNVTSLFYVVVSVVDILDAAERDGVPLPPTLTSAVRGLKSVTGVASTPSPTTTIVHTKRED